MTSRGIITGGPEGLEREHLARLLTQGVLAELALASAVVGLGVWIALGNVYLAYAVTFASTMFVALALPRTVPFLLLFAFLFQNVFVAFTARWVTDTALFDEMRAINFIMLVAAYVPFLLTAQIGTRDLPPAVVGWLRACLIVSGLVGVFFVLGLAIGNGKDAIVYFRNIFAPLACFHIALICGARFRPLSVPVLAVAALVIIGYGYCELLFTTDFLRLFNGDQYIWLRMRDEILSGAFQERLESTGFVLRGIRDYMDVPLFNITGADDEVVHIFRLSGPNFHPISYGYALSILAAWLFANRIYWIVPLALPVMIFVGSKGATILLILFVAMYLASRIFRPATARPLFLGVLVAYVAVALYLGRRLGDYHVLGLMAGLREFLQNPLGHGIGTGGVLSAAGAAVDWEQAQAVGATDVPVESAFGVLLYQMGLCAFVYLGFVLAVGVRCWRAFVARREPVFLFGYVAIFACTANAVFQEEAIFAPLALGTCFLLVGSALGVLLGEEAITGRRARED